MKKCVICLLCFAIALLCIGCGAYDIAFDGYENFSKSHSDFELNHYILPDLEFPDKFPYINIDYCLRENYKAAYDFTEKSLIVIHYDKETYEQAKEYCLQNMQLLDAEPMEYNDYVFMKNIELAIKQDRYDTYADYPTWFNMFAFNDEENCLVFMGFYAARLVIADHVCDSWEEYLEMYSDTYDGSLVAQEVHNNWGAFLENFFADIYDWQAGKIIRP